MALSKAALTTGVLLVLSACGNYSNTDLDFQLAIPARNDLALSLPTTAPPVISDSSQYYLETRKVVTTCNGIIDALIGLIDHMRSLPPTERQNDTRVWGPYMDGGVQSG